MPEADPIVMRSRQILVYVVLGVFAFVVIPLALLAARRNRRPRDDE
jgi:hypothetical protein